MAKPESTKLHIAMFPWLAMGHMTPYLHLSNQLAARGHKVSFLLPRKAQSPLEHMNIHPNLITFHTVTVPHVNGLPPGTETASEIPLSLNNKLAIAMDLMRYQIEASLLALKPDIVFYDFAYWVPELAPEIKFKTVCYMVVSAASIAFKLVPARNPPKDRQLTVAELVEPPPGYPSSIVVHRERDAASMSFLHMEFGRGITFYDRIVTAMKRCDAISIRTCQELEGHLCAYIAKQFGKPVILSGPLLPELATAQLEDPWLKWLDGFKPSSVVFCVFGSQIVLEKEQFLELLLGFELTGFPFFVALKPPSGTASVEEGFPEGFRERIQGRGIVHGGWVNQPSILSHPSVGCFVNHCGFASMWESLMNSPQIVLMPHIPDQILNTRLLAEELQIAVEVCSDENGWVSKEMICSAIKTVMDTESGVGSLIKKNHEKWKQIVTSPCFGSDYFNKFTESLYML